jgi:hypothetical protein
MKQNSISSTLRIDYRIVLALATLIGVVFFISLSAATYRIGFPLDDAWIHLTYARNFATHGEWAFRVGDSSAGSTSPLWTALLAVGYLVRLAPYAWTYFLGWVVLCVLAIRAENVARKMIEAYQPKIPWVGLFVALEWHMTWSATSGMETILQGLIVLIVLGSLMEGARQYLTLGLLAGLSVWVRPDGLTLLGPILLVALLQEKTLKERGSALLKVFIGFGILFVFFLLFNLALSGKPMPNTFYAKQAEYQEYWLSKPLTERIGDYLLPMIASPFVVLVPGLVLFAYRFIREKNWGVIAGLVWFIGYIGIYFMRLPAYQHGRYILPAFPILYLWGMLGLISYVSSPEANQRLKMIWQSLIVLLVVMFQWVGARQNAQDVIFIETQMVKTAEWVNTNLSPNALLAVHDIGAIGYFTQNPILDLAGLITPEVVPFIRDEAELAEYLDASNAEFLITFPSWYPQLIEGKVLIFEAGEDSFPFMDNMSVYTWE